MFKCVALLPTGCFHLMPNLWFFLAVLCPSGLSLECDQSFSFSFLKGYIEIISVHYVNILEKEFA